MDDENLVLYLLWKTFDERERGSYARGNLFGVGRRKSGEREQDGNEVDDEQNTDMQRIRIFKNSPKNVTNDINYDLELLRLAVQFEKLYGYAGVMRLVAAYPARSDRTQYNIGLIIDRSVHSEAVRKLGIVQGGSTQAALDFVNSIKARTSLGSDLLQAFRDRVTKDG